MNSGEIARAAGVSVRTLRHYHQVGVLPEPVRRPNGYREYSVRDLVLLLRIRRLTELGIPLDEIPPLLDDPGRADSVLDDLDRELAGQIERLTERRAVIARLRAAGAGPDIPPDLAELVAVTGPDMPPDLARHDREMMLLLHHGLDDHGREAMLELVGRVVDPALLPEANELALRFAALGPHSTAEEIDELADSYHRTLGHLGYERFESVDVRTGALVVAYQQAVFNQVQRDFLDRLGSGAPGPGTPPSGA